MTHLIKSYLLKLCCVTEITIIRLLDCQMQASGESGKCRVSGESTVQIASSQLQKLSHERNSNMFQETTTFRRNPKGGMFYDSHYQMSLSVPEMFVVLVSGSGKDVHYFPVINESWNLTIQIVIFSRGNYKVGKGGGRRMRRMRERREEKDKGAILG